MDTIISTSAGYIYVASSWRNPVHADVCARLASEGLAHYDFKNPPGGTGFSWKEVKTDEPAIERWCLHCSQPIVFATFRNTGRWEPDYDPYNDPEVWRHVRSGYASCGGGRIFAEPGPKPKGSDWEAADEYLRMIAHPRAIEGYNSDFAAMRAADTFVMVLPCGKSAHLELGWAVGSRQTACRKSGHEWTDPKNVRVRQNGRRWCAECDRLAMRARYARRKAA